LLTGAASPNSSDIAPKMTSCISIPASRSSIERTDFADIDSFFRIFGWLVTFFKGFIMKKLLSVTIVFVVFLASFASLRAQTQVMRPAVAFVKPDRSILYIKQPDSAVQSYD